MDRSTLFPECGADDVRDAETLMARSNVVTVGVVEDLLTLTCSVTLVGKEDRSGRLLVYRSTNQSYDLVALLVSRLLSQGLLAYENAIGLETSASGWLIDRLDTQGAIERCCAIRSRNDYSGGVDEYFAAVLMRLRPKPLNHLAFDFHGM